MRHASACARSPVRATARALRGVAEPASASTIRHVHRRAAAIAPRTGERPAASGNGCVQRARSRRDCGRDAPPDARRPSTSRMRASTRRRTAAGRCSTIASNTGCTSVGELLMTFRISAVAVCRSSASLVSLNRRTFSIAITAWSAKVLSSAICLSLNGPAHCAADAIAPMALALAQDRHGQERPVAAGLRAPRPGARPGPWQTSDVTSARRLRRPRRDGLARCTGRDRAPRGVCARRGDAARRHHVQQTVAVDREQAAAMAAAQARGGARPSRRAPAGRRWASSR